MEDIELKNIWKEYDRRLEEARVLNLQSWALNMQCFETLQRQKMKSKLGRLALVKIIMIVLGLIWVLFVGFLIVHSLEWSKIFFVLSATAIFAITLYAVIVYIRHLVLIHEINNSESIVDTQLTLARLQSSTIHIARILFLQAPFYTTFYYTPAWIASGDKGFWLVTLPVSLLFAVASLWLYRNISWKNAHKKWFKVLFNSPEWNYVVQSVGFIKEIEDFKQNI